MIGLAAMFATLSFRSQQLDPLTLIGCAIPQGVRGGETVVQQPASADLEGQRGTDT
jgi:hypothetical protein